jgi:hypothetical protein
LLLEFHRPRGLSPGDSAATDWRFGLPDYLGLRQVHLSNLLTINSLYVQYYADIADPSTVIDYEHYQMDTDPQQIDNLATGKIAELDVIIRQFYGASGNKSREMDTQGTTSG